MPIRPRMTYQVTDARLRDHLEHLRIGTVEQDTSTWVVCPAGASVDIRHNLGEIPRVVDILKSTDSTGMQAAAAGSDATVTAKSATLCTVTNNASTTLYFQVRVL